MKKRKIKILPKPEKPKFELKPPVRGHIWRCTEIKGGTKLELIEQLAKLPDASHISSNGGTCTNEECYNYYAGEEPAIIASYQSLETDEELQKRISSYNLALKSHNKLVRGYETKLKVWEEWYAENKTLIEAQEREEKEAHKESLRNYIKATQKKLRLLETNED